MGEAIWSCQCEVPAASSAVGAHVYRHLLLVAKANGTTGRFSDSPVQCLERRVPTRTAVPTGHFHRPNASGLRGRRGARQVIARLDDPWFEAEFYGKANDLGGHHCQGPNIEGAQGLFLWCPCSYGHDERAHGLIIPFANPRNAPQLPLNHGPYARNDPTRRVRWTMSGTGLQDLTLVPSVDVGTPPCWHGHITNGEIT